MLYYLLIYMFSYLQYINISKLKNKSLHTLYKHYYPLTHHVYIYITNPKNNLSFTLTLTIRVNSRST